MSQEAATPEKQKALANLAKGRETRRKNRESGILTGRRKKFADLMVDPRMSPRAAYIECGYSEVSASKGAWRLMADPVVKHYIEARRREIAERNKVTENEVISSLRQLRDQAEQDGSWAAAIRATELLGKYMDMFGNAGKVTVENPIHAREVFITSPDASDRKAQLDRLAKIGGTPKGGSGDED